MIKSKTSKLDVIIYPHEVCEDLRQIINSRIKEKEHSYCKHKKMYIVTIHDIQIPKYGKSSRTNFIVTFNVSCTINYIKPAIGDVMRAMMLNKNQYGYFFANEYCKCIVPKQYVSHDHSDQYEINREYTMEIVDVRCTENISCICKFVNS